MRPVLPIIDRTVTVSADGLKARLAELPTRKEMYRAVLLARRASDRAGRLAPPASSLRGTRPRRTSVVAGALGAPAPADS
jgi:hypothetical protein